LTVAVTVFGTAFISAQDRRAPAPPSGQAIDYERDVRPILTQCFGCHGPRKALSGLRLDLRQNALRGGDYGVVIVPGRSGESKLIMRLAGSTAGTQMPPDGPLPAHEIDILRAWIDQGAEWPDAASVKVADKFDQWSLKPIVRPEPKTFAGADAAWVRNPIDSFVLAKLKEKGLAPSAEHGREPSGGQRGSCPRTGLEER
jgi:mono/diheme cytochrome c family protein